MMSSLVVSLFVFFILISGLNDIKGKNIETASSKGLDCLVDIVIELSNDLCFENSIHAVINRPLLKTEMTELELRKPFLVPDRCICIKKQAKKFNIEKYTEKALFEGKYYRIRSYFCKTKELSQDYS